jgi:class 3 adenylate cyclase
VTAGVLSGEKARFQLFGDTINTAARMENTGQKNKIHSSQATATLLVKAGKDYWFVVREKHVTAKGKGEMQTYWVNTRKCLMKGKGNREAVPPENNAHD